ncbi:MAG: ABC transporter ATP-binding protein [Candidatus Bathyarchaeia archaeon]
MPKINSSETLLKVENLVTYFYTSAGIVKAVDDITFDVKQGEVVGLVGESGSGKSVTCLSILRTVPRPGKIAGGKILFKGSNLLEKSEAEMQKIRGKEISMIFQNPAFSLNPIYTIGEQLVEILRWHTGLNKEEAVERVLKLLKAVRLSDPEKRFNQYPHELSGGMKQRVVIARALLCNPSLLLADEPTTNVDVTVQAQLLNLLNDLKKDFGMTILFVTHDMGIVAQLTNRVVVLYSGKVCEIAETETIFSNPGHPYTEALISSVPRFDYKTERRQKLKVIDGSIPDPISPPPGCRFHPRCAYAKEICKSKVPDLIELERGHIVSCFNAEK